MRQLNQIIDQVNFRRSLFNKPNIDLSVAADREFMADELNCMMSPENVAMDGECSPAEANRRWAFYEKAARQLLSIDSSLELYELY